MSYTAKDMAPAIGRKGIYHINGLGIQVTIVNVRQVFNRLDVLIVPVSGHGQVWVAASSVSLTAAANGACVEHQNGVIARY
jgi:hypothetical protein